MNYYITLTHRADSKIISKHDTLDEALIAGKNVYEKSNRGDVVSCISGTIGEDGNIEGKYRLYKSWF